MTNLDVDDFAPELPDDDGWLAGTAGRDGNPVVIAAPAAPFDGDSIARVVAGASAEGLTRAAARWDFMEAIAEDAARHRLDDFHAETYSALHARAFDALADSVTWETRQ